MRRAVLMAAVVGAWAAPTAARDDTYTIRLRPDQPGDKAEVTRVDAETVKYTLTAAGKVQTRETKTGLKAVYTQEVAERAAGAKRPARLVRVYQTAERTADGKAEKLAYDGKAVTIRREGPRYTFAAGKGEELAAADAAELDREFNAGPDDPVRNEDLMPNRPVRLNEAWSVDPEAVLKGFEAHTRFTMDRATSAVTGKLTRVYEKAGARYGVIELTMTLTPAGLTHDGRELKLKAGSAVTARIDLDGCIDGSSADVTSSHRTTIDLRPDVPDGTLTITAEATGKRVVKQVGKK